MKIGPYAIGRGALLAPMAGITNPPFRRLCCEMGAALTVTELISSHALSLLGSRPVSRQRKLANATLPLMERFPGESPLSVQIFGRDPHMMAEASRVVVDRGADIVDLNFGCPARKVVKNGEGAGSALLLAPDLLEEITRRVVLAVTVPVTAKIRLGWSPSARNAPEVAKRLQRAGVAAITVHARTRDQVHSGPVDLDTLAEVCDSVEIPVIGNGGIRSAEDASKMLSRTGCARVAVGQAARGNPWIFRQMLGAADAPSLEERIATCRRHLDLYVEWAGEQRAAKEMRKHLSWYLKGFAGAAAVRKRLSRAVDISSFHSLLDEIR